MESPANFKDWELLQNSDTPLGSDEANKGLDEAVDGDSDNGISLDYFDLDSRKRFSGDKVSEEENLGGSDNLSWIDPNSYSWYSGRRRLELGIGPIKVSGRGCGGSWTSDESSDDQKSPVCRESGPQTFEASSQIEAGFGETGGFAVNHEESLLDSSGKEENFGGAEAEDSTSTRDMIECFERSLKKRCSENVRGGNGKKAGVVWWKLPLEFLKFYAFKFRPVWSISIAAALMGFIMLGQKLYKNKRRSRNIPVEISINDKKASQFMVRAARLNEAFSMVRRMPIGKMTLPAPGTSPWPATAFR